MGIREDLDKSDFTAKEKALIGIARQADPTPLRMGDEQFQALRTPGVTDAEIVEAPGVMVTAPTVAIDLPLKALVWENEAGNVWLGYNSPEFLKKRHGIEGKDESLKVLAVALDAMTGKVME